MAEITLQSSNLIIISKPFAPSYTLLSFCKGNNVNGLPNYESNDLQWLSQICKVKQDLNHTLKKHKSVCVCLSMAIAEPLYLFLVSVCVCVKIVHQLLKVHQVSISWQKSEGAAEVSEDWTLPSTELISNLQEWHCGPSLQPEALGCSLDVSSDVITVSISRCSWVSHDNLLMSQSCLCEQGSRNSLSKTLPISSI